MILIIEQNYRAGQLTYDLLDFVPDRIFVLVHIIVIFLIILMLKNVIAILS